MDFSFGHIVDGEQVFCSKFCTRIEKMNPDNWRRRFDWPFFSVKVMIVAL